MLESITLRFSEPPHQISISARGIRVFVGPNNSGGVVMLQPWDKGLRHHAPLSL
jgi:hypothetical protein